MRLDRDFARIVVPPVLALGLVALVMHPVDAAPSPTPVTAVATTGR